MEALLPTCQAHALLPLLQDYLLEFEAGSHCAAPAGLNLLLYQLDPELPGLPGPDSQGLGIKACITSPCLLPSLPAASLTTCMLLLKLLKGSTQLPPPQVSETCHLPPGSPEGDSFAVSPSPPTINPPTLKETLAKV